MWPGAKTDKFGKVCHPDDMFDGVCDLARPKRHARYVKTLAVAKRRLTRCPVVFRGRDLFWYLDGPGDAFVLNLWLCNGITVPEDPLGNPNNEPPDGVSGEELRAARLAYIDRLIEMFRPLPNPNKVLKPHKPAQGVKPDDSTDLLS